MNYLLTNNNEILGLYSGLKKILEMIVAIDNPEVKHVEVLFQPSKTIYSLTFTMNDDGEFEETISNRVCMKRMNRMMRGMKKRQSENVAATQPSHLFADDVRFKARTENTLKAYDVYGLSVNKHLPK